jgi:hypothetical protein
MCVYLYLGPRSTLISLVSQQEYKVARLVTEMRWWHVGCPCGPRVKECRGAAEGLVWEFVCDFAGVYLV